MESKSRKKIRAFNVEYCLTDHCNLSCYACDHASPLLPRKFASLKSFSKDMTALSKVLHSTRLQLLGGEPLLHPQLLDFLAEAKRIGVSEQIMVLTNGALLHKMPEEFYALIDTLWVSIYPGVKLQVDWSACSRLCHSNGVELRIWHKDQFIQSLVNHPIEDPGLVKKVFQECRMVGPKGCPTVYEGRFYRCSISPFMAPRLALRGISFENREEDSVPLHGNPALYEGVEWALKSPAPLAACAYCLGSSGPKAPHHQLNRDGRTEWLQENSRAAIQSTKERLLP